MRLVTYESGKRSTPWSGSVDKKWRAGVMVDGKIVDATTVAIAAEMKFQTDWISNREIIRLNPDQQSQFERAAFAVGADSPPSKLDMFPIAEVRLGPPIPDPDKIICLGLNYCSHVEETGLATYQVPILFAKYRNTLTGPTSPIVLPSLHPHPQPICQVNDITTGSTGPETIPSLLDRVDNKRCSLFLVDWAQTSEPVPTTWPKLSEAPGVVLQADSCLDTSNAPAMTGDRWGWPTPAG